MYPKLEIESEFRGLLEQLSLFFCLFVEIKSEFKALLELLSDLSYPRAQFYSKSMFHPQAKPGWYSDPWSAFRSKEKVQK